MSLNRLAGGIVERRKRPFRFEQMSLNHHNCSDIIKSSWFSEVGEGKLLDRLDATRTDLSKWNSDVFRHVGRKVKQLQCELAREWDVVNPTPNMEKIKILEQKLDALLEREEIM